MSCLISDEIKFFIVEKAYQHEIYETIVKLVKIALNKQFARNNNKNC